MESKDFAELLISIYQHIDFADKMLEEYDKLFGSQISVNTEVFRTPDEGLEEYLK